MKYKPGDKVKIRADLNPNDDYGGLIPVLSMCGERGKVATIKNSEVRDGLQLYRIEGDMCNFLWTGEMFEKTTDKEKAGAAMEYKAGDKVRVRKDLSADNYYGGVFCNSDMARKAGKIVTIKHKSLNGRYKIEEDSWAWSWASEMFEGIAEEQKTTKYKVGDKVLVRNDLEHDKRYSDVRFDKDMEKYRGGQATITKVYEKFKTYEIDLDQGRYMWGDDMFEGLVYVIPTPATKVMKGAAMKYKVGDIVRFVKDCVLSTAETIRAGSIWRVKEATANYYELGHKDKHLRDVAAVIERYLVDDCCEKINTAPSQNDAVSHPSHYTDGKIEVIDFIEDKKLGYHLGNACKYISRCQLKYGGKKRIEDLEKAIWYIKRQIEVWRQDDKQKAEQSR